MADRTKPYVLWQGRVSKEKIPSCEIRLVHMLRKENTVVCEVRDEDALGDLAWRPAASHILSVVTEVALIAMRDELDSRDVIDLPPVGAP